MSWAHWTPEHQEGGVPKAAHIRSASTARPYQVDLPLEPFTLNERLFDIGIWLFERKIPHQTRIQMEPEHGHIRICFPNAAEAQAFRKRFEARLN